MGYADIATLLLACFASLYAQAHRQLLTMPPPPAPKPPVIERARVPDALEATLQDAVKTESRAASMAVGETSRGLVISLAEAGSFAAGRADLSAGAREALLTLANALRPIPNLIRVEGHTDDVPIHTGLFASNWELSTARATKVVELLIDEGGIDPARLAAAGYGQHRPKVPNDTSELRAENRRVDIVVLDHAAENDEPPGGTR
jgi:chemotaxis protein MotB